MEYFVRTTYPEKVKNGCIVIAAHETPGLSTAGTHFDTLSQGALSAVLKMGDLEGKCGQTLMCHRLLGLPAERVLCVGAGREGALSAKRFRDMLKQAALTLSQTTCQEVYCTLTELHVEQRDDAWKCSQAVEIFEEASYRFEQFKTEKLARKPSLKKIYLKLAPSTGQTPAKRQINLCETAVKQAYALSQGMALCKDLANLPANICTPEYLAQEARSLGRAFSSIEVNSLDVKGLTKLGMGALLGVGQGSVHEPRFIIVQYGAKKAKKAPIVLVGKGITFDTGGNSLKSPSNMIGMKYDMCGAATVLGIIKAAALLNLPLNLVGLIPSAENMPGGQAIRPDDILKTLSGLTVEVLNTDAEGRLILADALSYAERFKPAAVIDIATLTGACVTALGRHASGLLSNNEALAQALLKAGEWSHDRAWQLPLWEDYQEALASPFADMANIGGPEAGTITAACFLSRFTKKYAWAHLDVAGTACRFSGKDKGASGRPMPLLMKYLINESIPLDS